MQAVLSRAAACRPAAIFPCGGFSGLICYHLLRFPPGNHDIHAVRPDAGGRAGQGKTAADVWNYCMKRYNDAAQCISLLPETMPAPGRIILQKSVERAFPVFFFRTFAPKYRKKLWKESLLKEL
jgi:hypothetical protein